jgi:soluble lytic murein transglycosylase
MMAALRAQDWASAGRLAAQEGDAGLAAELVTFIRLLKPGHATPEEITAFLKAHPDWPDRPVLLKRLGEAVIADPDDSAVLAICEAQHFPASPLARCADAYAAAGRQAQAATLAREAWTGGISDPSEASAFLARWSGVLTAEDEWRRFQRLADTDTAAAAREIRRLDPGHRQAALARLAWRRDDPAALALLASVPEALRGDPALVLENARSLRRTGALAAAVSLWHDAGATAEASVSADARAPFWAERDSLARKLLAAGDDADAAFLAGDTLLNGDQAAESLFLSGWIAFRRTHDTALALARLRALAAVSHSAITQARAHYWLARALEAASNPTEAHAEYASAATWCTAYYGQLAAETLGGAAARLQAAEDPAWTAAQALSFAGLELARAAELLVKWGDGLRARDFVLRLAEDQPEPAARSWTGHLALRLQMPAVAVQIARLAGRTGVMLPDAGWPIPMSIPPENAPLVLAIMRQESNFDPLVVSPAGARGLMQVMPATARVMAAGRADLFDPAANTRIGSAYLQHLLDQFSDQPALAAAAYNAGPNRVRAWLAADSPALTDPKEMIDWLELIPFAETRNYVQRVLEGEKIFAAKITQKGKG